VIDEVQVVLENHSIELDAANTTLLVQGDILRLEQVLQNLLQNAIKYSPEGGTVRVRLERREQWACLVVVDQGIGIPPEALSQMFQPFYRAPNTLERPIVGMGIGLYVVKEIVALHGGEVEVNSVEGQGSTFLVRLPLLTTT
jgi:signal transduction histidine kinase